MTRGDSVHVWFSFYKLKSFRYTVFELVQNSATYITKICDPVWPSVVITKSAQRALLKKTETYW